MDDNYAYESNGAAEPIPHDGVDHNAGIYATHESNGASPVPANGNPIGNGLNGSAVPTLVRKTLASWVGFSNLPNQVHRRSVR
jgi:septin 7